MKSTLVIEDGMPWFAIKKIDGVHDHIFDFEIYETVSWNEDDTVHEDELYMKGSIKWDGCSHIYFGDEDGYLHICGVWAFKKHIKVIEAVYKMAQSEIKNFDKDEEWNE